MNSKQLAAEYAVQYVKDGMIVGLGTGSTSYYAIEKLGQRVAEGLSIKAIATSVQSEVQARKLGIPIIGFGDIEAIDLTIDGADEVDSNLQLIKGGGGALLREKIVAKASKQMIVIVDESKLVTTLGKFPLPVEIVKFGYEATLRKLQQFGCELNIRTRDGQWFVTDNGNYIVDCYFSEIHSPEVLHDQLKMITGVVDNGLFIHMASKVVVGSEDGTINVIEK